MAKCEFCGREMLEADGCKCSHIEIGGKTVERIKFGDPRDLHYYGQERCGDCNVKAGHYHHPGCDGERCPVCGLQLLMCECDAGHLI